MKQRGHLVEDIPAHNPACAQMANINRQTSSPVETVFLAASPEISHISSTQVRQIAQLKGDVSMFCPTSICEKLKAKLN